MKTNFINTTTISAFAALLCLTVNAQTPTWSWAIDSDGPRSEALLDAVVASDGSIYTYGEYNDSFTLGGIEVTIPTPWESGVFNWYIYLCKFSSTGEVEWVKPLYDADDNYWIWNQGLMLAIDSEDNLYMTGSVLRRSAVGEFEVDILGASFTFPLPNDPDNQWANRDSFIAKIDPDGNALWVRHTATPEHPGGIGGRLVIDDNDNIFWAGTFQKDAIEIDGIVHYKLGEPGTLLNDIFLGCLTPAGIFQWFQTFGNEGNEGPLQIAAAAGGGVFIGSTWTEDTVYVAGLTAVNPDPIIGQNPDRWIAKIGVDGSAQWLVHEEGPAWMNGGGVCTTSSGGVMVFTGLVANTSINGINYDEIGDYLAGYSSTGELELVKFYPSFRLRNIITDGNDNYFGGVNFGGANFTIGDYQFTNAGDPGTRDIAIGSVDLDGNVLWAVSVGGSEDDVFYGLSYHPGNGLIVTGKFSSDTLQFGSTNLINTGLFTHDLFLAALDFTSSVTNAPGVQPLHLYPNPADIHVSVNLTSISAKQHTLRIFDTRGSLVLSQNVMGGNVEKLEISNLPKGSYVVLIHVDGVVHASKFIKL